MKRWLIALAAVWASIDCAHARAAETVDGFQRHSSLFRPYRMGDCDGYLFSEVVSYPRLSRYSANIVPYYESRAGFYRSSPATTLPPGWKPHPDGSRFKYIVE